MGEKKRKKGPKLSVSESRKVLDSISNDEWKKLSLHLINTIKKKGKVLGIEHIIDERDVVFEAISLLYSGDREWDGNKNHLFSFLYNGVVRSIVFHTRKREIKKEELLPKFFNKNPLHCNGQHSENRREIFKYVISILQKDELAVKIIECIFLGATSHDDIAYMTDRDLNEINNAFKRIKRKLKKRKFYMKS